MKLKIQHVTTYIILICVFIINSGCADPKFLDQTKIDGSILRGDSVELTDPIAQKTVLIVQNFELKNERLQYFGLCSGVILNSTTIITAAHCATDLKNSRVITTNNAHFGKIQQQQIYNIKNVIIHEKYINPDTKKIDLSFDLALLFLERPVDPNAYDSGYLISISTYQYIQNSNLINLRPTIAGFGKNKILEPKNTDNAIIEPINGILEKAQIQLDGEDYTSRTILINQQDKAGACSGDSGGPLFVFREEKMYLQGIAVAIFNTPKETREFGKKACNNQSLYINLDFHKDWLNKKIGN